MSKNQKGFSTIEGVLIVVIVLLLGAVGWVVYNKNYNKTPRNSTTNTSTTNQTSTEKKTTTKSASLGNASYSLALPNGWNFKEVSTEDSANEKLVYVIDPTNTLQLEVQILGSAATSGSTSTGLTSLKSFKGINDKTYYIHGYKGTSTVADAYEMLQISSCSDKHCYTTINNNYSLNLTIRGADLSTPTKADNPIIDDILAIVQSIKLGS